jgi:hypothetical protein
MRDLKNILGSIVFAFTGVLGIFWGAFMPLAYSPWLLLVGLPFIGVGALAALVGGRTIWAHILWHTRYRDR